MEFSIVQFVRCLAFVLHALNFSVASEDHCRTLHFTHRMRGKALTGHVLKNLSLEIPASCQTLCYLESDCVSYNLGPEKDGKFVCELSDSDSKVHDGDLVPREGFVYRETENPCSKSPCSAEQKCQNGFTDKGYRCTCPDDSVMRNSIGENWEKVNSCPVCFGARNGTHGAFTIKKPGLIVRIKLVHRSGNVSCNEAKYGSNWGCPLGHYGNKQLHTIITYADKTLLLPAKHLLVLKGGCAVRYSYALDGVHVNDEELVFPAFTSPVHVSCDQEFLIWYGQDLANCSEENNSGESCVDVYAWYN